MPDACISKPISQATSARSQAALRRLHIFFGNGPDVQHRLGTGSGTGFLRKQTAVGLTNDHARQLRSTAQSLMHSFTSPALSWTFLKFFPGRSVFSSIT